jgi:hypothetical protein
MEHRTPSQGSTIPIGFILNPVIQGALFYGNAYAFRIADPKSAAVYAACKVLLFPIGTYVFGNAGAVLSCLRLASKKPELFTEQNKEDSGEILRELKKGAALGIISGSAFTVFAAMKASTKFASSLGIRRVIVLELAAIISRISLQIVYEQSGLDRVKATVAFGDLKKY